jgi:hypothetical protein
MNKRPPLYLVLEGFLNRESWAEHSIREHALAVGGSSVDQNYSRSKPGHQRRLDLKALCEDFYKMLPVNCMDSIVKFFND